MKVAGVMFVQSKHGLKATVQHSISVTKQSLHVLHLVGTCGATKHEHNVTIGAVDGKRYAPPTSEEVQAMLDKYRQHVADEAAWKESVRLAIQNLV